jgi:hypothetical protein
MPNLIERVLVSLAAVMSILGAAAIWSSEASIQSSALWPLPALVLFNWAGLGFLGALAVYLAEKSDRNWLLGIPWAITGALLPMVVLGVFSIGPLVLVSALLFLVASAVVTLRRQRSFLHGLGLLLVGSVGNVALLFLLIAIGNPGL